MNLSDRDSRARAPFLPRPHARAPSARASRITARRLDRALASRASRHSTRTLAQALADMEVEKIADIFVRACVCVWRRASSRVAAARRTFSTPRVRVGRFIASIASTAMGRRARVLRYRPADV
jgi:hypothetical protein